jgi:hypothetical protein
LVSIAITGSATVATGSTTQLTATGTYSDSSTADLTNSATWLSGTTSHATISSTGLLTGVAAGTTSITAALGGITSPGFTVTDVSSSRTLVSIAITGSATVATGGTTQLTATGTYSDSSTANLTNSATWRSGTTSHATVNATGLVTGVAPGPTSITAALSNVTSPGFTVTDTSGPTLVSIAVTGTASATVGGSSQLTATGTYSDSSTQNLSSLATWTSSVPTDATVSSSGLVRGFMAGTLSITAAYNGVTSPGFSFTVNPSQSGSTACTPGPATSGWVKATLPSAMTMGSSFYIQSIYAGPDCYVYASVTANGTWRVKASDLRDGPTTAANWTKIDSGFPADSLHGGTAYCQSWTSDAAGNIYCGIGEVAPGAQCTYCVIAKWDGSSWTFSNTPPGSRSALNGLSFDASGNLYVSDRSSDFYVSANVSGAFTFGSALVRDAYTPFGFTSGQSYASFVINGNIYWGGEGPYMKSPLTLVSGTAIHGAAFAGNVCCFDSDGGPGTAPTYILGASRVDSNGYDMFRYNVGTNTYTDLESAAGIPQYGTFNVQGLDHAGSNTNGGTANVHYAAFVSSTGCGVIKSTNSGNTWSCFNSGLPTAEQNNATRMTVSPWDNSVYLTTGTSPSSNGVELWLYPMTS